MHLGTYVPVVTFMLHPIVVLTARDLTGNSTSSFFLLTRVFPGLIGAGILFFGAFTWSVSMLGFAFAQHGIGPLVL